MSYPVTYDGLCRTCLKKSENVADIFMSEKNNVPLATAIMECSPVHIIMGDGMPAQICNECLNKLHEAHRFREMCLQADRTLHQYLAAVSSSNNSQMTTQQDPKREYAVKQENATLLDDSLHIISSIETATSHVHKLMPTSNVIVVNPRDSTASKTKTMTLSNSIMRPDDSKRFSCDVCEKTFPVNNALIKHYRIHSGERPYKCNICGKNFNCSSTLSVHIRFHNNDRRYKCELCEKSYVVKSHLTVHMRSHTGEHPYSCHVCDKRFRISKSLTRHLKNNTCERVANEFRMQKFRMAM